MEGEWGNGADSNRKLCILCLCETIRSLEPWLNKRAIYHSHHRRCLLAMTDASGVLPNRCFWTTTKAYLHHLLQESSNDSIRVVLEKASIVTSPRRKKTERGERAAKSRDAVEPDEDTL